MPPDGQPLRIEIGHRPKETGQITYIVEVESKPRELQTENNRIEKTVTVREEKLKVLYVHSEPRTSSGTSIPSSTARRRST